jgi:uncharacterized protein (TIGR03435 family)
MLRTLLADRFTLRVHTETKEQQVYALVLARSDGRLGPKLTRSTQECERPATSAGRGPALPPTKSPCGINVNTSATSGTLDGIGQPLSRLATMLSGFAVESTVISSPHYRSNSGSNSSRRADQWNSW